MKKIFLILALSVSFTINADLLNGPYSPESQELVEVIEGLKNVPAKFKDIQAKILKLKELFAESYSQFAINVRANPRFTDLAQSDPTFLQAIIQLLKISNEPDNALYQIALLAAEIRDLALFEQAVKQSSQMIKVTWLLRDILIDFSKNDLIVQQKIGDPAFINHAQQAYEFDKKLLKILSSYIDKESLQKNIKINILNYNVDNKDRITFLVSIGGDINRIEGTSTLLDQAIKFLDAAKKSHTGSRKSQENFDKILQVVNFLRSRGARTYAELTAAQKGQK